MEQNRRIFVMGDIHQNAAPIKSLKKTLETKGEIVDSSFVLIMLGDFGGNVFFDSRDRNFKKGLAKFGFTYFVIRGNHEERAAVAAQMNPEGWEVELFFDGFVLVEKEFPYIKYAFDGAGLYSIKGKTAIVFPGAYSVDKYFRLQHNYFWFEDEQMSEHERILGEQLVKTTDNIEIVLSHTCPKIYQPTDLFLSSIDQSMVDDTFEIYLNRMEMQIPYKLWLFGHYHAYRVYPQYEKGKQMMMLYNGKILDLDKYFETNDPYISTIEI